MEHLISAFLIQQKSCTLPQVGTLRIKPGSARVLTADKMLAGPVPEIEFDKEKDNWHHELVDFIAAEKRMPAEQAATELSAFCSSVQQLFGNMEVVLPGAGRFYADSEGLLHFRQDPLPESFMPPIPAIRVAHPGMSHTMKVGDNEISSHRMPEIINNPGKQNRLTWWVAALFILLVSTGLFFYYFSVTGSSGTFGNSRSTEPKEQNTLYRVP